MNNVELAPYIFFKGNAREAFEFYKSVFGGDLKMQTNNDTPKDIQDQMGVNDQNRNQLMHARLDGGLVTLMGSDSKNASDKAAKIELSISGTDEAKLREVYDKLAEGGKATMPIAKQFWGDLFGMVTDKYGVDWMVNIGSSLNT